MSRGYPASLGNRALAGSAARTLAGRQLSGGLASGAGRFLRNLPGPPSGSIPGAAIAFGIGYAMQYFLGKDGSKEPPPLTPPGGGFGGAGSQSINQQLTYWGERVGAHYNREGAFTIYEGSRLQDFRLVKTEAWANGPSNTVHFRPDDTVHDVGTWQLNQDGIFITHVPANWWYGVSLEIKALPIPDERERWLSNRIAIYLNETAEEIPPVISSPPAFVPGFSPGTWAPSRGISLPGVSTPDGASNPPLVPPVVGGIQGVRGIGVNADGAIVNPMVPGGEVKGAATAATMRLIRESIGRAGEGIDYMRCMMFAVGNTYRTRDGSEKAIPRWRWGEALARLSGEQAPKAQTAGRRNASVRRGADIVTADGRILTPQQVGARLAACLIANEVEDQIYGRASQAVSRVGADVGLTAGPFGVESLWGAASGGTPYRDLFNMWG